MGGRGQIACKRGNQRHPDVDGNVPEHSIILYACNSRLIVDFLEICLKNEVRVKAIINNQVGTINNEVAWVDGATYDFAGEDTPFLVPLFTPRNRYLASLEALGLGLKPYALLSDCRNDLPRDFGHGSGCFINKGAIIGAGTRMGDFVLINRGACLGHHTVMRDFVSIGPGVVTGGDVVMGLGSTVGTGAVVLPGVTIGQNAVVGAGAVVTKDVADGSVVSGNPARHVKQNPHGFQPGA